MTDNRKCSSINSFKVIVNRKNNVPFHFEEFYNDHVHFVILLQKKRKEIMPSESMASREINIKLRNISSYKPSSVSTSRCSRCTCLVEYSARVSA
jgi:hypothetical protein